MRGVYDPAAVAPIAHLAMALLDLLRGAGLPPDDRSEVAAILVSAWVEGHAPAAEVVGARRIAEAASRDARHRPAFVGSERYALAFGADCVEWAVVLASDMVRGAAAVADVRTYQRYAAESAERTLLALHARPDLAAAWVVHAMSPTAPSSWRATT